MTILYAADDDYAKMLGVSLYSLLACHADVKDLEIVVLDDGICAENKARLLKMAADFGRTLRFFDVNVYLQRLKSEGMSAWSWEGKDSYAASARIMLASILPRTCERVLYLDCDTLVCGSLTSLFSHELQAGCVLGAVCDCSHTLYKKYLGIPVTRRYWNSGVLLIDLARWRARDCENRLMGVLCQQPKVGVFPDQDCLNLVLGDEIETLDFCYNVQSVSRLYVYDAFLTAYNLTAQTFYTQSVYANAQKNPVICHFSGLSYVRPWFQNSNDPMAPLYQFLLKKTPWGSEPLSVRAYPFNCRVRYYLSRILPQPLFGKLSAYAQVALMHKLYGSEGV